MKCFSIPATAAATFGHLDLVKHYFGKVKDPKDRKSTATSICELALMNGDKQMIEYIMQLEPDIQCEHFGRFIAMGGHLELFEMFPVSEEEYFQLVHYAAAHGQKRVLEWVWSRGHKIYPELKTAVIGGNKDIIDLVISQGSYFDLNAALFTAAARGYNEIVEYLIELGAHDMKMKERGEAAFEKTKQFFWKYARKRIQ